MFDQPTQGLLSDGVTRFKPVAFALFSLLIIFFLYQVVGGGITLYLFGNVLQVSDTFELRLTTMLGEILLILVPTLFLASLQAKNWPAFLRMRRTDWYFVGLAIVGVISLQQLMELYLYVQSLVPLPNQISQKLDQFQKTIEQTYRLLITSHSPTEFLYVILVVAVTPAICEELLFRGLIQSNLELPASRRKAILSTGIIFGAYHLDPASFVALCVLGIYLGYLVSATGSILVPIAAHFANNFVSTLILYSSGKESLIAPGDKTLTLGYITLWSFLLFLIFVTSVRLTAKHEKSRSSNRETDLKRSGNRTA